MTGREKMVEKAARAHVQARRGVTGKVNSSDLMSMHYALDAILPQVSTVSELEALPVHTLLHRGDERGSTIYLVNGLGILVVLRSDRNAAGYVQATDVIAWHGSLTVVWQP